VKKVLKPGDLPVTERLAIGDFFANDRDSRCDDHCPTTRGRQKNSPR
jgi:hypothetical protein